MAERRTLIEGLKPATPLVDVPKAMEVEFVYGKQSNRVVESKPPATIHRGASAPRVPVSTRMRSDLASALKRASLMRQLAGDHPNTVIDILEEALEPWLREKGYLKGHGEAE